MCSNSWAAFSSLTQLLIGFAALAVVTEVVFGAEMFPGMTVVDNLTSLITTLGNGGFVGLVALFDPLEHSHEEVSDAVEGAVAQRK